MTSVAVVILNYNGENLLKVFLPSIVSFSQQAQIIVIDNGSTDQSIGFTQTHYPEIQIVRLEKNQGFCRGYNEGLKRVQAEYYVLLNSDVEVTEGWLNSPLSLLRSNPSIAAVQPKILSYKNRNQFEYAGAAGGFIDILCYPYCRGRIFETLETDHGQYDDQQEVFWGSGACLFIRSKTFHQLGGFEEDFFAHMEEIDLCWRIHRAGQKVMYDGKSRVFHLGGGTLPVTSPKKTFYNFRNNLSLIIKNQSLGAIVFILPIRIGLDWLAAFKFALDGNMRSSIAIVEAHFRFFLSLGRELSRRQLTKRYPFGIEKELIKKKIIVLDYYLRGRKKFIS